MKPENDIVLEKLDLRHAKVIGIVQRGLYKSLPESEIKEIGTLVQKQIEDLKYKKERRKTAKILSHLKLLDDIEKNGKRIWEGDYEEVNKKLKQIPEEYRKRIMYI